MTGVHIQLYRSGSPEHLADLKRFRAQGLPVPYFYRHRPLSNTRIIRKWVRALGPDKQQLICAFIVELAPSRAMPGMRIGKVERLGRSLHQQGISKIGDILAETAKKIHCLLRLDVQVFDEDETRRRALMAMITKAGGKPARQPRRYSHTLMLDITKSDDELMQVLSARTRRSIRKSTKCPMIEIRPILDMRYTSRMLELHAETFARTAAKPHFLDVEGMFSDSKNSSDALLLGAFRLRKHQPHELVAFAWATMQGDHAVYERAASVRIQGANSISSGAVLMWHLLRWARDQGADWFDFGGITPLDVEKDHPLLGISTFKRGFSNIEREVATEFCFEPLPFLTAAARLERKVARKLKLGQAWHLLQQLA